MCSLLYIDLVEHYDMCSALGCGDWGYGCVFEMLSKGKGNVIEHMWRSCQSCSGGGGGLSNTPVFRLEFQISKVWQ